MSTAYRRRPIQSSRPAPSCVARRAQQTCEGQCDRTVSPCSPGAKHLASGEFLASTAPATPGCIAMSTATRSAISVTIEGRHLSAGAVSAAWLSELGPREENQDHALSWLDGDGSSRWPTDSAATLGAATQHEQPSSRCLGASTRPARCSRRSRRPTEQLPNWPRDASNAPGGKRIDARHRRCALLRGPHPVGCLSG